MLLSGCSGRQEAEQASGRETEQAPEQKTKPVSIMDIFEEGRTVQIGNGYSIFIEKKDGMTLRGVRIVQKKPDGSQVTAEAETAVIASTGEQMDLNMFNVTFHSGSSTHRSRVWSIQLPVAGPRLNKTVSGYRKPDAPTPDNAGAYCDIGIACDKSGRHAEAIAAFKKAIALKPDYFTAHCGMGIAYGKLKQWSNAVAAYRKAIAIRPSSETADALRKRIIQIESRN